MKILLENYLLANLEERKKIMQDFLWEQSLLIKLGTSSYQQHTKYFPQQRQFLKELRSSEIHTYFISQTVSKYLIDNGEQLMEKMWKFLNDLPDETGCILWNQWTYFYKKFNDGDEAIILFLICNKNKSELGSIRKNKNKPEVELVMDTVPQKVGSFLSTLFLPFIEFAECETKIVNKTNKKVKMNNEKYISTIPDNIEIVDSSWFITLIHSDAFKVSGHFRLQPIGEGRKQRKMIWIKDFEKQGYTKKSKIETKHNI